MSLLAAITAFQVVKGTLEQIEKLRDITPLIKQSSFEELSKSIEVATSPYLRNILISELHKKEFELDKEEYEQPTNQPELDIASIKSEAYSESIGQILHELEPILGSLHLHASLEIDNFNDSQTFQDFELLESTILTFEDWRKVERLARYKDVLISEITSSVISSLKQKYDVGIIDNTSDSLEVKTDQSMLRIIILNVIRNAIQATSEHELKLAPIIINSGVTDKEFWLTVIDNGDGIKEKKEILMSSRYSTKPGNRGLGLTIVNKAVQALDGNWELKNGAARGAEFYLELPLREQ